MQRKIKCPNCGTETLVWRSRCPNCGENLHKDEGELPSSERQFWKSQQNIAGVFNLVVGVIMLVFLIPYTVTMGKRWDWDPVLLAIIGVFFIAAGLLAVSGVFALRRTHPKLVITGAIISFFIPLIGLAGGIMTILSREDWLKTRRRWLIIMFTIIGVPVSLFLGLAFLSSLI